MCRSSRLLSNGASEPHAGPTLQIWGVVVVRWCFGHVLILLTCFLRGWNLARLLLLWAMR
jgi:hypothetical protein